MIGSAAFSLVDSNVLYVYVIIHDWLEGLDRANACFVAGLIWMKPRLPPIMIKTSLRSLVQWLFQVIQVHIIHVLAMHIILIFTLVGLLCVAGKFIVVIKVFVVEEGT